jgi:ABC-type transport system involved in multi-copper enzyme maturation permease subunit
MFQNFTMENWVTLALLAAAAALVIVVLLGLTVGLFQARSLIRREFAAYFLSPIGYVVLVVFLAVTGYLFAVTLGLLTTTGPKGTEWPMQSMFAGEDLFGGAGSTAQRLFWLVFLFIPPLLTMRLFAEERSTGTLEMLMTAPLRDWQVVLAKYLACLGFYIVIWLPTLAYLPALLGAEWPVVKPVWTLYSLTLLGGLGLLLVGLLLLFPRVGTTLRLVSVLFVVVGAAAAVTGGILHYHRDPEHLLEVPVRLDNAAVLTTYLGMFLAGAMFLAIGMLISSLVRDQMVSAILAIALSLLFVVPAFWRPEPYGNWVQQVLYFFSVPLHFHDDFTRGRIDTRPILLYATTAMLCVFLTVRSLESRRWQ